MSLVRSHTLNSSLFDKLTDTLNKIRAIIAPPGKPHKQEKILKQAQILINNSKAAFDQKKDFALRPLITTLKEVVIATMISTKRANKKIKANLITVLNDCVIDLTTYGVEKDTCHVYDFALSQEKERTAQATKILKGELDSFLETYKALNNMQLMLRERYREDIVSLGEKITNLEEKNESLTKIISAHEAEIQKDAAEYANKTTRIEDEVAKRLDTIASLIATRDENISTIISLKQTIERMQQEALTQAEDYNKQLQSKVETEKKLQTDFARQRLSYEKQLRELNSVTQKQTAELTELTAHHNFVVAELNNKQNELQTLQVTQKASIYELTKKYEAQLQQLITENTAIKKAYDTDRQELNAENARLRNLLSLPKINLHHLSPEDFKYSPGVTPPASSQSSHSYINQLFATDTPGTDFNAVPIANLDDLEISTPQGEIAQANVELCGVEIASAISSSEDNSAEAECSEPQNAALNVIQEEPGDEEKHDHDAAELYPASLTMALR